MNNSILPTIFSWGWVYSCTMIFAFLFRTFSGHCLFTKKIGVRSSISQALHRMCHLMRYPNCNFNVVWGLVFLFFVFFNVDVTNMVWLALVISGGGGCRPMNVISCPILGFRSFRLFPYWSCNSLQGDGYALLIEFFRLSTWLQRVSGRSPFVGRVK